MSDSLTTYALVAGMGTIAGMRSMAPPTLLSRHLSRSGERRGRGRLARLLSARSGQAVLSLLAGGEMAADKTPWVPDRTQLSALANRVLMGALSGAAIAEVRGRSVWGAALIGASSAVGGAYLAYGLRKKMEERLGLPSAVLGFLEDAAVYAAGARLAAAVE